ncbi:CDP-alcohol phosphatidyltransferase family protein [Janibacter sp. G368]
MAIHENSWAWLVAAYLVYWIGDIADGWFARRLQQETVVGAVLDIVCDRACTTLAAAAFIHLEPAASLPLAIFLLQFCVVDMMLSLAFLPLGVISPNYFHRVDQRIYDLNWSPPAKALNTSLVVIAAVAGQFEVAALIALALLGVKLFSTHRLLTVVWPRQSTQAR